MRLAVLVSGRGSNLSAALDAIRDGQIRGLEPVLVISNRAGVGALEVATRHGVRTLVLRRSDFGGDPAARDRAIGEALASSSVELALLAGYDQTLLPAYFAAYRGRTINVHPSLLPAHGGSGMLGLAVHRAVLAAGDAETGATIHEVTESLDAGPVIAQQRVRIQPGEEAEALATRVLEVEHRLLVWTLGRLAARPVAGASSARMSGAPRYAMPRHSAEDR